MSLSLPFEAARQLLAQYATALNMADTAALPAFYTADGTFLPDGRAPLPAPALAASGQRFLAAARFRIHYEVEQVSGSGEYAFVQATARTSATDQATGQPVERTSRDFFVLRQQAQTWKIYRYLFNSVRVQ